MISGVGCGAKAFYLGGVGGGGGRAADWGLCCVMMMMMMMMMMTILIIIAIGLTLQLLVPFVLSLCLSLLCVFGRAGGRGWQGVLSYG